MAPKSPVVSRKSLAQPAVLRSSPAHRSSSSGGTASNTTVKAGGTIFISSGGVLSNTIVSAGGIVDIEDGGSLNLSGTTVSNAGSINLLGKAGGSGATLVIDFERDTLRRRQGLPVFERQ